MGKDKYNPKKTLEKLDDARRMLWIHGMINESERELITKRIIRWGTRYGLNIQREPVFPTITEDKDNGKV